jgi:hypothetical protein
VGNYLNPFTLVGDKMKVNLRELKKLTLKTKKTIESERKKIETGKEAKDEKWKKQNELRAKYILETIPATVKLEATKGRDFAVVMGLRPSTDYQYNVRSGGFNELQPSELVGSAAIVYRECNKIFEKLTLEFWQAVPGSHVECGFSLIVHW